MRVGTGSAGAAGGTENEFPERAVSEEFKFADMSSDAISNDVFEEAAGAVQCPSCARMRNDVVCDG